MNQNQTPLRTPQRPQRTSESTNHTPAPKTKNHGVIVGLLIGTVSLLVISLIVLCVVLAIGGLDQKKSSGKNDGGEGGDGGNPVEQGGEVSTPSAPALKAKYLSLPSVTASGSYRANGAVGEDLTDNVNVKPAAAILVDVSSGAVLAGKNADVKIYPASMTKVMTVLLACEKATDPTAKLTVTQEMVDYHKNTGGSGMMGFSAGESITVEDALFLASYDSDTIACLLLAEHIAGSEAEFAKMMTQRAKQIGCANTNFVNSTGLHSENHYTTCRDMAAIMECAMSNPAAKELLSSNKAYQVTIYNGDAIKRNGLAYTGWVNDDGRVGNNLWVGNGSDLKFFAGKTGYEDVPSSCFVTVAQHSETGKYYVCVTVGRINESQTKVTNGDSTAAAKYLYRTYVG